VKLPFYFTVGLLSHSERVTAARAATPRRRRAALERERAEQLRERAARAETVTAEWGYDATWFRL